MASSPASRDFEQLGLFYLGRRYDLGTGRTLDEPVLYDSRDLVTHAVCVGMTGSGKTGLCLGLIEEAAIDGVPVHRHRSQGRHRQPAADVSRADARGVPSVDRPRTRRAGREWMPDDVCRPAGRDLGEGPAEWGQDGDRIAAPPSTRPTSPSTRRAARPGMPVSIVSSFAAPPRRCATMPNCSPSAPAERRRALLVLSGVDADAVAAASTACCPTILTACLAARRRSGSRGLIREIQAPPFDRVGVIDLESFFPAKERFELAMQLNNVLAAPGFADVARGRAARHPATLLYTADGQAPRVDLFDRAPRRTPSACSSSRCC